jgi:hypothetical protein
VALTSRCGTDKNRALFAAGGELRRVGTAVLKIQASEVTHF